MLDNAHQIIAGVVLLTVIGIAYGGTFLLRVVRGGQPANDLQKSFFPGLGRGRPDHRRHRLTPARAGFRATSRSGPGG
jgi:hypothetical protein